jgi:hypothetical protein
MQHDQRIPWNRADRVDRPFRWPAVRVRGAIEQRHQLFDGADGRAVGVLAYLRDDLALLNRQLGIGE